MKRFYLAIAITFASCLNSLSILRSATAQDSLPSWNDTTAKRSIIAFVELVTKVGSTSFVAPAQRIAVFDNDGTLWCENPIPFQVAFALDEIKRLSLLNPDLNSDPMVQAALAGDIGKLIEGKHHDGLMQILALTHAGITTDEFDARVKTWLKSSKHPRFGKPYSELTYQPMQELLSYLRDNGFKTFIVSGGGADFMRVFSEEVYGIVPEQVVGSTSQAEFKWKDGKPVLVKTLNHLFVDDQEGKPVGIQQFIGRRPIACFGNSDGDQAMLEYTTIGNPLPSFGLIVHHTDADQEYAYDANPKSSGKLTTALTAAPKNDWTIVDMKTDWKTLWTEPSSQADSPQAALFGKWLAEDIAGKGVIDNAQSTLELKEDGTVSGNTCVNNFGGKATIDNQKIQFGPLATTRRAGPPALMEQESKYTQALKKAVAYRLDANGLLFFIDADQKDILRFSKILP